MVANRRLQDQQRHEDAFIVQEGEGDDDGGSKKKCKREGMNDLPSRTKRIKMSMKLLEKGCECPEK